MPLEGSGRPRPHRAEFLLLFLMRCSVLWRYGNRATFLLLESALQHVYSPFCTRNASLLRISWCQFERTPLYFAADKSFTG